MKIALAGGGIGGLTAALCLAQRGMDVEVFEQAHEFAEVGAGIQLSPNCSRVLHDLGLAQALEAVAFLPQGTEFRHWRSGNVISKNSLGPDIAERYGAPYYHIHRGDLLRVLFTAATDNARIQLNTSAKVAGFSQSDQAVEVQTESGNACVDVLIGTDGIRSVVRAGLWGDSAPSFTGNLAWRAQVPVDRLPAGLIQPNATVWWGPGKHFVHYFVRGGALLNCVCVVEKSGWEVESWTEPGTHAELKEDFSGWNDTIQTLLDNADKEALFKWGLFDRAPMEKWGRGRVSLLGDACHPTLPFMAQGAAMAIEDAAVLAGCLQGADDAATGLARYEDLRRPRTAGIQNGSRRNATVFHLSGVKAWFRNIAAGAARKGTMDGLYRYNALEVAAREAEGER